MATFISTVKFTGQGIQTVGETANRAAVVKSAAKHMGVEVTDIYWTLGVHDGYLIFQAADDETAAAFLLQLGSQGNVQTTTSRAFTATEMDTVLGKIL